MRLRSTRSAGREGCHEAEKTHAHGRSDSGSACHVRAGKPTAAAYGHSRHQAGAFQYFYTLHHGNARPRLGFRAVFDARHARLRYHRAGLGIFIQLRGRALRVCAHASAQEQTQGKHALGSERTVRHGAQHRTAGRRCGHCKNRRGLELSAGSDTGSDTGRDVNRPLRPAGAEPAGKGGVLPKETGSKKQEEEANG